MNWLTGEKIVFYEAMHPTAALGLDAYFKIDARICFIRDCYREPQEHVQAVGLTLQIRMPS